MTHEPTDIGPAPRDCGFRLCAGSSLTVIVASIGLAVGAAVGVGGYTFVYARGASYLTDDPAACANCHVMKDHFDAWVKASHHTVATCNDCHTPSAWLGKYLTKASNGFHHSLAFTTGRFHEPIRITPRNHEITEAACRRCHSDVVHMIDTRPLIPARTPGKEDRISCVRCHASVGHLR